MSLRGPPFKVNPEWWAFFVYRICEPVEWRIRWAHFAVWRCLECPQEKNLKNFQKSCRFFGLHVAVGGWGAKTSHALWQMNTHSLRLQFRCCAEARAKVVGAPWSVLRRAIEPAASAGLPPTWPWQPEWQWYSRPATALLCRITQWGRLCQNDRGVKLPWGRIAICRLATSGNQLLIPAHRVSRTNSVHT